MKPTSYISIQNLFDDAITSQEKVDHIMNQLKREAPTTWFLLQEALNNLIEEKDGI